jgi:hypothetical protein
MVVMARAVGMPARLVVGYARGDFDPVNQRYIVTEAEAHSWVEIYFPRIGWIPFEPTASRPEVGRGWTPTILEPERVAGGGLLASLLANWPGGILAALGVVLGLIAGFFVWSLVAGWRLRRLPAAKMLRHIYQRLYRIGGALAVPMPGGQTPSEFAEALLLRANDIGAQTRWRVRLQFPQDALHQLTEAYTRTIYSPYQPGSDVQGQTVVLWWRLRRKLWALRLLAYWQRLSAKWA